MSNRRDVADQLRRIATLIEFGTGDIPPVSVHIYAGCTAIGGSMSAEVERSVKNVAAEFGIESVTVNPSQTLSELTAKTDWIVPVRILGFVAGMDGEDAWSSQVDKREW